MHFENELDGNKMPSIIINILWISVECSDNLYLSTKLTWLDNLFVCTHFSCPGQTFISKAIYIYIYIYANIHFTVQSSGYSVLYMFILMHTHTHTHTYKCVHLWNFAPLTSIIFSSTISPRSACANYSIVGFNHVIWPKYITFSINKGVHLSFFVQYTGPYDLWHV